MKRKINPDVKSVTVNGPNLMLELDCRACPVDGHHRDDWVVVHRGRNVGLSTPFRMVVLTGQVDGIPLTHDQHQWISGLVSDVEDWCCQWEYYYSGATHDWATPQACVAQ